MRALTQREIDGFALHRRCGHQHLREVREMADRLAILKLNAQARDQARQRVTKWPALKEGRCPS